jgi:hypothetical protein
MKFVLNYCHRSRLQIQEQINYEQINLMEIFIPSDVLPPFSGVSVCLCLFVTFFVPCTDGRSPSVRTLRFPSTELSVHRFNSLPLNKKSDGNFTFSDVNLMFSIPSDVLPQGFCVFVCVCLCFCQTFFLSHSINGRSPSVRTLNLHLDCAIGHV